ncbi:hypothetical protein Taro_044117 [Colocasia esculenta]|uniref:Major facilitator superfamily (MFS) profile domain-containing protein n=1 Tax=Colocasia esculenta TaxID=4460 RepID=A0A843WL18_COLES|nr:hypothetical protein [Colocasia esculenta]
MAGAVLISAAEGGRDYPGKLTSFVLLTCLVTASGGLIFGYDIGISGGVTSMDSFLEKFFPSVYRKESAAAAAARATSQYCKFDNQLLTAFTSSLYLAALVASLFASTVTRGCGRKFSMLLGGVTFLSGAVINGAARDVAMLIVGRILLGVGVGFVTQSGPVYLSEMAPAQYRGMLNIGFQLMITVGILAANLVNYGAAKIKGGWGWRISLAGAAVPAAIITVGSIFLPDTPNSLVDRGKPDQARDLLRKLRGTDAVDLEFGDLVAASSQSRQVKHPWKSIVARRYRPQLTMALLIPAFTQLTGINVVMFYAPVLFKTIGFGDNNALMSAVITGLVNVLATFVSIYYADRAGRRKLYLEGGIQMFICQMLVGTLIWKEFGVSGEGSFDKGTAAVVVLLVCVFVAGFAWSWGPMACLVPTEIFPLEIRSAGLSISVSVSMLWTFAIAQVFLALLCRLKFGLFYFFAGWVAVMSAFVYWFLPETKNVPLEEMARVWRTHWYWRRFVSDDGLTGSGGDVELEKDKSGYT